MYYSAQKGSCPHMQAAPSFSLFFILIGKNRLYRSVLIVIKLGKFHCPAVIDSAGIFTVMVEQIPFSPVFYDRMMRRPSDDRFHDASPVCKRSHRVVRCRIDDIMCRPCRIRQIIFPLIFVHPGIFKISFILVGGKERFSVFIQYNDLSRFMLKR